VVRRARKKQDPFVKKIKESLVNSQTLPLIFVVSVIGIMFVLIRMKGIEQDYQFNDIEKRVSIQQVQNKELKAKRARQLSMKKLKAYAKKFDLSEPDEKRIIIIP
jgi:cell division protein FtsL